MEPSESVTPAVEEEATTFTLNLDAPLEDVDISDIVPQPIPDEPLTTFEMILPDVDVSGIVPDPVPDEQPSVEIALSDAVLASADVDISGIVPEPISEEPPEGNNAIASILQEPASEPAAVVESDTVIVTVTEPEPEPEPEVVVPKNVEEPPAVEVPVEAIVAAEELKSELAPDPISIEVPVPEPEVIVVEPQVEPVAVFVEETPKEEPTIEVVVPEEPSKEEQAAIAVEPITVQIEEEPPVEVFVDASALSPSPAPPLSVEQIIADFKTAVQAAPEPVVEPAVPELPGESQPADVEVIEEKPAVVVVDEVPPAPAPPPEPVPVPVVEVKVEEKTEEKPEPLKTPLEKKPSLQKQTSSKAEAVEKPTLVEEPKAKPAEPTDVTTHRKPADSTADNLRRKEKEPAKDAIPPPSQPMATIAVDLGDIDDIAPIEVIVPPAAPAPAKTAPLSVAIGDAPTDEFRTPVSSGSGKAKSISFAATLSSPPQPVASSLSPSQSAALAPPRFSPAKQLLEPSPKSPAPQAFVPPNLDESLRETYMEHVTYYTNRILPFTQSAKSLVNRQSTLLDRLRSMRSEMEKAERELDLAVDEFDVLKRSTINRTRRLMMAEEMGVMENPELLGAGDFANDGESYDDNGLLMTSSCVDTTPSLYRSSAFRRNRSSNREQQRSSWYAPRSGRSYLDEPAADEEESTATRYKFRSSSRPLASSSYTTSYSRNKYAFDDKPPIYYQVVKPSDDEYLCEHEAGGIAYDAADDEMMAPTIASSVGRYSSQYSGGRLKIGEDDEDLLKSTRRFEDTLRSLRTTYSSLGPAPTADDLSTSSRSSKFTTTLHAI